MGGGQKDFNKYFVFLITAFIFLISTQVVKAEGWKNIFPFKSTQADVEKILGKCENIELSSSCLYKMEDQNVYISFTTGVSCEKGSTWNVAKGTVEKISIYLKTGGIILSKLNIKLKDFVEEEDPEILGLKHFNNKKKGIEFEVEGGFVKTLRYGPTLKERKKFVCSKDYQTSK
jgi:hypothetical protein